MPARGSSRFWPSAFPWLQSGRGIIDPPQHFPRPCKVKPGDGMGSVRPTNSRGCEQADFSRLVERGLGSAGEGGRLPLPPEPETIQDHPYFKLPPQQTSEVVGVGRLADEGKGDSERPSCSPRKSGGPQPSRARWLLLHFCGLFLPHSLEVLPVDKERAPPSRNSKSQPAPC